ncbi:LacI family DNA-binding transcriptional regulator [Candidatus Pantoea multigeneris]|uniref:LacI family DNA-binding transcriptional regulator n=1 Tax=Candidatus Pantoea multigeneris TaxID=2608357 RepID=A0ABX0RKB2_9GAMM|nr:LacI family DNA-binding transcriptional regulator [Pantoea multigeneris]NIF23755.1 LacI family DNA-binding transcriptional regulator [Pantoea multigeneris]
MKNTAAKGHKATASDVAKQAGVSKWTVSRAFTPGASISKKARDSVMAVARELDYRPNLLARSLSKKRTNIIGVVIDELKNPHSLMILDEATRQLQSRGYMALMLNITAEAHYRSVMSLADQLQVDGILFLGTILSAEFISIAEDMHHIPLVQVCRNTDAQDIDVVAISGFSAGKQIAELMLEQGFKRFGFMKGPDTPTSHLQRKEGFEAGLSEAGVELEILLKAGNYERQRGWSAMEQYLQQTPAEQRIEALFCENDILALGAMAAQRELAPESPIAIVGFDDIEEASSPGWQLTSYSQRIDRLMEEAICRLVDGTPGANTDWQQGELRIRRSHLKN